MSDGPHEKFTVREEKGGFVVCQNGKALETPLHFSLSVPTHALAQAISQEFAAQGSKKDARKMPLTQLALAAIDVAGPRRADVVAGIMRFGETELICQRAEEPEDLAVEQEKVWTPYLEWCRNEFGAKLKIGAGIAPFNQDPEALKALRAAIEAFDAFSLVGLSEACGILGSLVLSLALQSGRATADEAVEAAELESLWQTRKWGEDSVSEGRITALKADLALCERWTSLLRASS